MTVFPTLFCTLSLLLTSLPFVYLQPEKGTSFVPSLPVSTIIELPPPPPPPGNYIRNFPVYLVPHAFYLRPLWLLWYNYHRHVLRQSHHEVFTWSTSLLVVAIFFAHYDATLAAIFVAERVRHKNNAKVGLWKFWALALAVATNARVSFVCDAIPFLEITATHAPKTTSRRLVRMKYSQTCIKRSGGYQSPENCFLNYCNSDLYSTVTSIIKRSR